MPINLGLAVHKPEVLFIGMGAISLTNAEGQSSTLPLRIRFGASVMVPGIRVRETFRQRREDETIGSLARSAVEDPYVTKTLKGGNSGEGEP